MLIEFRNDTLNAFHLFLFIVKLQALQVLYRNYSQGLIAFIFQGWEERTSDAHLTENSGLLTAYPSLKWILHIDCQGSVFM